VHGRHNNNIHRNWDKPIRNVNYNNISRTLSLIRIDPLLEEKCSDRLSRVAIIESDILELVKLSKTVSVCSVLQAM
jgi:hypothetical protein